MLNKIQAGHRGQDAAMKFLLSKGMTLLEANFRIPSGEIDLIMRDGEYIVFIEVKYRQNLEYGLPREAIGYRKQQRIKKTALYYIVRRNLQNQDFRFDAVELLDTSGGLTINHIENAFW